MKRLGEVVGAAQSLAICRAPDDEFAPIGTPVIDDSLADVGTVVDVFGPVDRPYIAVDPGERVHLPGLVGQPLYVRD